MRQRKASRHKVLTAVLHERERQDAKWGNEHDSYHTAYSWINILRAEIEEAAAEVSWQGCQTELLHVAAVAVAALEWHGVPTIVAVGHVPEEGEE